MGNCVGVGRKLCPYADCNCDRHVINTKLWNSVVRNDIERCKKLIRKGANVNLLLTDERYREAHTPLQIACDEENLELVKLLLKHGADVNLKGEVRDPPLKWALSKRKPNIELVKLLCKNGANVNQRLYSTVESYPLMMAVRTGSIETVKTLIEHGASLTSKDCSMDALVEAVKKDNEKMAEFLIKEYGANVNGALLKACMLNNPEMVKLLIDNGADVDHRDINGNTPLIYATKRTKGNYGIMRSVGITEEEALQDNEEFLENVSRNKLEIVKILLDEGADSTAVNNVHDTALSTAAKSNYFEIATILAKLAEDSDLKNFLRIAELQSAPVDIYQELLSRALNAEKSLIPFMRDDEKPELQEFKTFMDGLVDRGLPLAALENYMEQIYHNYDDLVHQAYLAYLFKYNIDSYRRIRNPNKSLKEIEEDLENLERKRRAFTRNPPVPRICEWERARG